MPFKWAYFVTFLFCKRLHNRNNELILWRSEHILKTLIYEDVFIAAAMMGDKVIAQLYMRRGYYWKLPVGQKIIDLSVLGFTHVYTVRSNIAAICQNIHKVNTVQHGGEVAPTILITQSCLRRECDCWPVVSSVYPWKYFHGQPKHSTDSVTTLSENKCGIACQHTNPVSPIAQLYQVTIALS